MGHAHGPGAGDGASRSVRRLLAALALAACYMVAEAIGGWLTGSLALLADAGHMLSDVGALGLSVFAMRLGQRPPTPRRTYGYRRAEILAALLNGGSMVAISVLILREAWDRFAAPPEVEGSLMLAIAAGGLVVNLVGLKILGPARGESLNVRGAWLHVLTDALGSVQAIVAGALILAFGWHWADPVASVLIALLVVYSAWALLRETVDVLMESVPSGIELEQVRSAMLAIEGVESLHDLHVWSISSGFVALSAHVQVGAASPADVLVRLRAMLEERFGITHSTIQTEPAGRPASIASRWPRPRD